MRTFTLSPRGPFSLDAVRRLQCGFLLGTRTCNLDDGAVTVAFPLDGSFRPVAVRLRPSGDGITAELFGSDDVDTARPQVERMLGLDHDGRPFFSLLEEDRVLAQLLARRPGFRPVVAASPYVMAAWLVLSQRTSMKHAARLQQRLAELAGSTVAVGAQTAHSFPAPERLLELGGMQGLSSEKWRRLQALATAALDGRLARERLMSMPWDSARQELLALRGIGPWTADGILIRGCGPTDVLPLSETTLHGAIRAAWKLKSVPSDAEVIARAEAWRPFRTWVSVFLISADFEAARAQRAA